MVQRGRFKAVVIVTGAGMYSRGASGYGFGVNSVRYKIQTWMRTAPTVVAYTSPKFCQNRPCTHSGPTNPTIHHHPRTPPLLFLPPFGLGVEGGVNAPPILPPGNASLLDDVAVFSSSSTFPLRPALFLKSRYPCEPEIDTPPPGSPPCGLGVASNSLCEDGDLARVSMSASYSKSMTSW